MIERIDITPHGMQTEEGIARVNHACEAFEGATALVANAAASFFDSQRCILLEITRGATISSEERAQLRCELRELEEAISLRNQKQEEFLRAVAGHPPVPPELAASLPSLLAGEGAAHDGAAER